MSAPGFEYFDSSMPGAPQLQPGVGSLIQFLDWVLLSKGGWEKVYSAAGLAVYRSLSGNRHYLRVDDTRSQYALLRGYRTMTGVSAGQNPFPTAVNSPTASFGLFKPSPDGNSPGRYWGIRTNRYIAFVYSYYGDETVDGSSMERVLIAFGDVPSLIPGDIANTILYASPQAVNYGDSIMNALYATPPVPGQGIDGSRGAFVSNPAGTQHALPAGVSAILGLAVSTNDSTSPYRMMTTFTHTATLLYSGTTATNNAGYVRGTLPGIRSVYGFIPSVAHNAAACYDQQVVTEGARSMICLSGYTTAKSLNVERGGVAVVMTDTEGAL